MNAGLDLLIAAMTGSNATPAVRPEELYPQLHQAALQVLNQWNLVDADEDTLAEFMQTMEAILGRTAMLDDQIRWYWLRLAASTDGEHLADILDEDPEFQDAFSRHPDGALVGMLAITLELLRVWGHLTSQDPLTLVEHIVEWDSTSV